LGGVFVVKRGHLLLICFVEVMVIKCFLFSVLEGCDDGLGHSRLSEEAIFVRDGIAPRVLRMQYLLVRKPDGFFDETHVVQRTRLRGYLIVFATGAS
jgi:hypothetical protein